jgi:hypothetical protein
VIVVGSTKATCSAGPWANPAGSGTSIPFGVATAADAGVGSAVAACVATFAGAGAAAAGPGDGAQAAGGAAGAGTRDAAVGADAAGVTAHGFGLAAGGGFGVTSGRHDERDAKTPWYRTSGT